MTGEKKELSVGDLFCVGVIKFMDWGFRRESDTGFWAPELKGKE